MTEERKAVGLKLPISFFNMLLEETSEIGESMAGYAEKAVYERFNRDRLMGRLDRCPAAFVKHALQEGKKHGAKEK